MASEAMRLSARGYHRVLRVARALAGWAGAGLVRRSPASVGPGLRARTADVAQAAGRMPAQAMRLSARGYHRVLRVARTLADLDGEELVRRVHFAEALAYRALTDELRRAA